MSRPPGAVDASFRPVAAVAAIISLPLAAGNLVAMFAAVHFNLNAMSHPLLLIHEGPAGATLWHWAMVLDVLGYYLAVMPLVLALRSCVRPANPQWIDLSSLCLLGYALIGAIGGAILAAAIPPLIDSYGTAGAHQVVLETVFNGYANTIYTGMWNILEEFLAAIGWIGLGVVLHRGGRRLGKTTVILGLACLLDSVGTTLNMDAAANIGLATYLVLAPIWACWLGVLLLRNRSPFATGPQSAKTTGDGAPLADPTTDIPQPTEDGSIRPSTTPLRRR
jgi:pimeloyl-ACP methyl ester carboxylesterase